MEHERSRVSSLKHSRISWQTAITPHFKNQVRTPPERQARKVAGPSNSVGTSHLLTVGSLASGSQENTQTALIQEASEPLCLPLRQPPAEAAKRDATTSERHGRAGIIAALQASCRPC